MNGLMASKAVGEKIGSKVKATGKVCWKRDSGPRSQEIRKGRNAERGIVEYKGSERDFKTFHVKQ